MGEGCDAELGSWVVAGTEGLRIRSSPTRGESGVSHRYTRRRCVRGGGEGSIELGPSVGEVDIAPGPPVDEVSAELVPPMAEKGESGPRLRRAM